MADSGWTRIETLFDGALERPRAERETWLAEQCGDDDALRMEVERLLVAHERRGLLDFTPIVRANLDERLDSALAGRYTIERELGVGGMSTVFLAVEAKHERRVVIKVLNPDLAAWWGGDRFLREIRIAARLAHPHIVGLIDSGEADGLLYYVMPYIEGETLRARLDRAGPLPVSRAIVLLRDIASALAHAHAEGVIHRDLKPSNVLCAGDHAFLMDFGVAKLMEPGTGQFNITGTGVAVGTPAYMAPEQLRADSTVDHRIDLWSWGLLAVEMLAGRLPDIDPFADPHADRGAGALSRLHRVEVPRSLAKSIEECLAASPAERPASAEVLAERLARFTTGEMPIGERVRDAAYAARSHRVLLGLGLVAISAVALGLWRARSEPDLAFDRALDRYDAQDYRGAAPELRAAYRLDTTFLVPLVHAAAAYINTGERARADTVLAVLRARRAELSDYHRHVTEALEARLASDGQQSVASLRRAVQIAPTSRAAYDLATALIATDQPAEALTLLESLDPDREEMRGWSSYWTQLTHARHLMGAREREVDAARALRQRFPDRRVGIVLEARALAALGWHSALDSLIDSTLSLPPTTYWSQGAAMIVAGEELIAHGDPVRGHAWLERGVDWLQRQRAVGPAHEGHDYWLGSALYQLGRWREAARLFEALSREDPDDLSYHGLAALALARTEGIIAAERRFAAAPADELGEHFVYRARLATLGGDHARAASLLADAKRHGVSGMAWLHATARREVEALEHAGVPIPASLATPRR